MDTRKLKDKAQEAFSKGKFAKAGEAYEKFCEAEPTDLHARLRMGDAWSKAGQKDKAIGAYSWAAEGFAKEGFLPRAIAASKLILELDPAHKGVQKMLADLYARKNTPAKKAPTGSYAVASGPARAVPLEPEAAAKPAAPAQKPAAKGPEVPSPMNRADAIELPPEDDVVPEKKETAVDQKQRRNFEVRDDAIELAEEKPVDAGVSAKSAEAGPDGIELDIGPSSGTEIEIAIEPTPSAPPPPAPQPSAPPIEGVPLDGPLEAPILLDTPKKAAPPPLPLPPPPPPPPALGPKGGVYELDVGDDDESLDAYSAKLAATPSAPPPPPPAAKVPDPVPSAPLELSIEVEVPEPAAVVPAPPPPRVADSFFDPEAVDAPAPQADLPPPSLAIPSIAPIAAAPAVAEPPRPSPSAPPGLKPKRAQDPEAPVAAPAAAASEGAADARIWLPPGFAPPAVAPMVSAAPPRPAVPSTEARSASTDLEKSLEAFSRFDDDAPAVPAAPAVPKAAALPAMAGFTELDLDGDSLLHAVESAATQGAASRGEEAPVEEVLDAPEADASPGALPKIPLFSDLPEDAFIALFESCPLKRHEPGELVLAQGSQGAAFYVICAGSVRVFRTDAGRRRELATLDEGAFFGEMALLSDAPRSASVEAASEDTQLLEISAAVLANLSKQHPHVATALKKFCRQRMLSNLMSHAPLFQPFSKSDRRDLVQKFRSRETKKGDVVIKEGQRSDGMYVVLSGEVEVTVGASRAAVLKEGDVFGEMSLLTKAPAGATVTSTRHTSLLRLPREDFDMLILSHPQILVLVSELTDERNRANAKLAAPISGSATMV